MVKLTVDGVEIEVEDGMSVLQACEAAGAEIPRFCYHERLSIAGNCRMCLVEMERSPKPIASCAMPAGEGMVIRTNTPTVKKAREGVMEFLLINHPLDCPICDQGGECDLQDQAMAFGVDATRYEENKRAVEDKYLGPLVKTIMTRCIHCTRCVRFVTEVAGVEELGAIGRGEDMEITTYLEQAMTSEMSGNVIDLCPVGALTSKPYAFSARPWELKKTESVDVMDAVGSNIRVDTRGREVMRIMPRLHDDVNEEWISDKSRFIWDGLRTQRLDRPYIRDNGKLRPAEWSEAFAAIAAKVKASSPDRIAAIAGDQCAAEEMFALRDLMDAMGAASIDCRQDGSRLGETGGRAGYLFNSTISGVDQADAILLVGSNPRHEAAVLNARIRRHWRATGLPVGVVGAKSELNYDHTYLGAGPDTLKELVAGRNEFAETLKNAERPMIIIGMGALARSDGNAVLALAAQLAKDVGALGGDDWCGFNVLHTAASRVAGLDMCFLPREGGRDTAAILEGAGNGEVDIVYLLGADEIEADRLGDAFVVYQGTHGDRGAHRADVILPGAAYTEKNGLYVNTEGRPQMTRRAAFPPGDAREDWAILRALSDVLGHRLPFDSATQLRAKMFEELPHLAALDQVAGADLSELAAAANASADTLAEPFGVAVEDFYLTNPVARASKIMAECSALAAGTAQAGTGTDG